LKKDNSLVIGEFASLGTAPFFFPLKHVFNENSWRFVQGTPSELEDALHNGRVDVALATPMALASRPLDFLVYPDLGYASRRHIKDILLYSDMLLDDMDEMTVSVQAGSEMLFNLVRVILERYLGYQNNFMVGWGNADSFVLYGDAALRERILARYLYVYDVGDLWKHYTRLPIIHYLWVIRRKAALEKKERLIYFHRLLKRSLELVESDLSRMLKLMDGYQWIRNSMISQLWNKADYRIEPFHFDGLAKYFEDCQDLGIIEEVPEIEYFQYD